MELLFVLLEETSDQSAELFQKISQDVSLAAILSAMLEFWVKLTNTLNVSIGLELYKCRFIEFAYFFLLKNQKFQQNRSQRRESIRSGMFHAFHILRRVTIIRKSDEKKFGNFHFLLHVLLFTMYISISRFNLSQSLVMKCIEFPSSYFPFCILPLSPLFTGPHLSSLLIY